MNRTSGRPLPSGQWYNLLRNRKEVRGRTVNGLADCWTVRGIQYYIRQLAASYSFIDVRTLTVRGSTADEARNRALGVIAAAIQEERQTSSEIMNLNWACLTGLPGLPEASVGPARSVRRARPSGRSGLPVCRIARRIHDSAIQKGRYREKDACRAHPFGPEDFSVGPPDFFVCPQDFFVCLRRLFTITLRTFTGVPSDGVAAASSLATLFHTSPPVHGKRRVGECGGVCVKRS